MNPGTPTLLHLTTPDQTEGIELGMLPTNQQSPQERVLHNYKKYFEHSEQDLEITLTEIFNYSPSFYFRAIPLI